MFNAFSYDVVFTGGKDTIVDRFRKFGAKVVFSAEAFCWPDTGLQVSLFLLAVDVGRFLTISCDTLQPIYLFLMLSQTIHII